jgi:uncharacterized protein YkwD
MKAKKVFKRIGVVLLIFMIPIAYNAGYYLRGEANVKQEESHMTAQRHAPYADLDNRDIAAKVSEERVKAGMSPLAYNETLEQAACLKADHMIANDYWSHNAPDGTTPWSFIDKTGYRYLTAGENLAYGYRTEAGVVDGWMKSKTHKDNILGDYSEQGMCARYGVFQGGNNVVVVNMFGKR